MTLPSTVNVVRVRGFWYDQDGTGSGLKITFTPSKTLLIDAEAHAYIRLRPKEAIPDEGTSYFYADVIASNDPDLQPVVWTVGLEGEPPAFVVAVPYDAPFEDVGEAEDMRAIWLTEASA